MEHDAIVVGGGPAGLAAATALAGAGRRALVLHADTLGGQLPLVEWINDMPAGGRTEGPALATRLLAAAEAAGVVFEQGEAEGLEAYSSCHALNLHDGRTLTAPVVVVAGGLAEKKLGIPGEAQFAQRGVIHCASCDAALYAGQVVAVCGGGTAGALEALHLARHAASVHLFERGDALTAPPVLCERLLGHGRVTVHLQTQAAAITGEAAVSALTVVDRDGQARTLAVTGVLARIGYLPRTAWLDGVVDLDGSGRVVVDAGMRTSVAGVFAAGDIRADAPRRARSAIADGEAAAASALAHLAAQG